MKYAKALAIGELLCQGGDLLQALLPQRVGLIQVCIKLLRVHVGDDLPVNNCFIEYILHKHFIDLFDQRLLYIIQILCAWIIFKARKCGFIAFTVVDSIYKVDLNGDGEPVKGGRFISLDGYRAGTVTNNCSIDLEVAALIHQYEVGLIGKLVFKGVGELLTKRWYNRQGVVREAINGNGFGGYGDFGGFGGFGEEGDVGRAADSCYCVECCFSDIRIGAFCGLYPNRPIALLGLHSGSSIFTS